MSSTTLNALSLPQKLQPTVGASVHALLVAGRDLVSAIWYTAFAPAAVSAEAKTVFQEAEELRAFASTFQRTDPGFASDLFAAADRHESGAV
jgi:hypothetical protein